ncbi:hypothetical protein D3C75_897150 [compost metagenome]
MPLDPRQLHTNAGELVGLVEQAAGTHLVGQLRLRRGWHLDHEPATALHQLPGAGGLVEYHGHLGWVEIQRTGPGGRHHIVHPFVAGRHQHRRAVVQQAIGLFQVDGLEMAVHGNPRQGG